VPEISIKDQVRKLIEVQKLDAQIFEMKRALIEKPSLVEELKRQFESKKLRLSELEQKVKSVQLKRKEQELELQTKEQLIVKANSALNEIKTNREYTAKMSEIESLKADKSIIEEKILQLYDDGDALQKEIDKEKGVVAGEENKYLAKKKEVDDEVKLIDDRIKVLQGQRKQLTPDIDSVILSRYETILNKKDGLALAPITGSSCGGCFLNIRPQTFNAIKMGQDLIECESCSRILYLEDNL